MVAPSSIIAVGRLSNPYLLNMNHNREAITRRARGLGLCPPPPPTTRRFAYLQHPTSTLVGSCMSVGLEHILPPPLPCMT